jgi:zinc transport system permease protein
MNEFMDMFQLPFMVNILLGTILVGISCALLGVFVVLRREVFVGAALAQVASLGGVIGMCLGTWLGHAHADCAGDQLAAHAIAVGLAVVVAISLSGRHGEKRLPREAVIGIFYAGAAALGILLVATNVEVHSEVLSLLFGNVLTIARADVWGLAGLAGAVSLMLLLFGRRILLVSFDPDMAAGSGIRVRAWQFLLFAAIGITVALSILKAGALVVFAFLVLPASAGLLLAGSVRGMFGVALAISVGSAFIGVTLSYLADLPTGPTIVVTLLLPLLGGGLWRFAVLKHAG